MDIIFLAILVGCFDLFGRYLSHKLKNSNKHKSAKSSSFASDHIVSETSGSTINESVPPIQSGRPVARNSKSSGYASRKYFYIFTFFVASFCFGIGFFDIDYRLFGTDWVNDETAGLIGLIALVICLVGSLDTLLYLGLLDRGAGLNRKYLYLFAFALTPLCFGMGLFDLDYRLIGIDFVEDSVADAIGLITLTVYLFGFVDLLWHLPDRQENSVS